MTGQKLLPEEFLTSDDWAEELITGQLLQKFNPEIWRLIHPKLLVYSGPSGREPQEKGEPKVVLLDAWRGRAAHPQAGALQPESHSIEYFSGQVAGWQIRQQNDFALSFAELSEPGENRLALRILWAGQTIHSLAIPTNGFRVEVEEIEGGARALFHLSDAGPESEIELFCDISSETEILIDGKKATTFFPGQTIGIQTPKLAVSLRFDLAQGNGDFIGRIGCGNRPFQTAKEVYDWRLSLCALRCPPGSAITLLLTRYANM